MTNTQISPRMAEALVAVAEHVTSGRYEVVSYNGRNATMKALINRGMFVVVEVEDPTYGHAANIEISAAGWTWLKDNAGIERQADADRLTVEEALAEAFPDLGVLPVKDFTFTLNGDLYHGDGTAARSHRDPLPVREPGATEPPCRDEWLDQEAGSGPGAGPSQAQLSGRWATKPPGQDIPELADKVDIQDMSLSGVLSSKVHAAVIRETNRLTEARDAFTRDYVPEDDLYVDRDAWKAAEIRLQQVAASASASFRRLADATAAASDRGRARQAAFQARNGRPGRCGQELSTGRPCPQHAPEDTREQYTQRDTYGDPVTYRNIPVPADLAGHWYGIEAISWTRGVESVHRANLVALQKMRAGL